jgi:hypothetical protein
MVIAGIVVWFVGVLIVWAFIDAAARKEPPKR